MLTIDCAVTFLNDLLRIDRDAVQRLIEAQVVTNQAMADHPTVQVSEHPSTPGLYNLRLLGVLNGLFESHDPSRLLAAVYDDDTVELLRFEVRDAADFTHGGA